MRLKFAGCFFSVCLLAGMMAGCQTAAPPESSAASNAVGVTDGKLKILAIGNSFADDALEYAWQIADSLGCEEVHLGILYIGGCSLATHAENARYDWPAYEYRVNTSGTWKTTKNYRMSTAVQSDDWDFITLQQASGKSGEAESFDPYLDELVSCVSGLSPSSRIVWHMTWAYQQDSTHGDFSKYGMDQRQMYESIVNAVRQIIEPDPRIAAVIPSGTAIQNARTSFAGDTLTRDVYHLSIPLGRYIAGLMVIRTLCGVSVENLEYAPQGVSAEEKAMAIEAVEKAQATPFSITNL